ncbi:unnamed protein product [Macrosiphum euphorbiae]|uniref:Uncharacterized protein n=1 Tax=Macrosiphum euphorbiae TaxID=13131 RepID=A0AAV0WZP0_9HEMI|nr:unnamed protein product [Macrosiphum euphorbiae]
MKSQLPYIKIGLYINATSVIHYSSNSATPNSWYDIVMLNEVVDYYVIGFEQFNECTDALLKGGVTPMDSSDPNVNTLNKLKDALLMTNITKDKLYLEYLINPTVKKIDENTFKKCERSYNEYCENSGYKYRWCADNQQTFFDKGVFAKQYANGFIAREIDLVDRDLKCKCDENKYVTFYMVLNGFKGLNMLHCDKIDGS